MVWSSRIGVTVVIALASVASAACNGTRTPTAPVASVLEGGSKTPVTWTTQNMLSNVKIDLTVDDGATFTTLVPSVAFNAGPQEITLPNPQNDVNSTAFVRITSVDNASIRGDTAKFSITAMTERYVTFAEVAAIRPNAFPNNRQSAPTDCVYLDQVDGTLDATKYAALPRGVLYRIRCTAATGGVANPESFKDFMLSNGWVVSQVDTFQGAQGGNGRITCTLPAVGSTNLTTTCHMTSDRGGFSEFVVAPLIRGRKGTAPF